MKAADHLARAVSAMKAASAKHRQFVHYAQQAVTAQGEAETLREEMAREFEATITELRREISQLASQKEAQKKVVPPEALNPDLLKPPPDPEPTPEPEPPSEPLSPQDDRWESFFYAWHRDYMHRLKGES